MCSLARNNMHGLILIHSMLLQMFTKQIGMITNWFLSHNWRQEILSKPEEIHTLYMTHHSYVCTQTILNAQSWEFSFVLFRSIAFRKSPEGNS